MKKKHKYWDIIPPKKRSEEMKRRRAKGVEAGKIAGGMHYVDAEIRKRILEKARAARKYEKDTLKSQDGSQEPPEAEAPSKA